MISKATACLGKLPHDSKADAAKHARNIERRGGGRMETYRCPYCGFFHVCGAKRNQETQRVR